MLSTDTINHYRKFFPITERYIYLNHASISVDWIDFLKREGGPFLEEGTKNLAGIYGFRENLRMIIEIGIENIEE